MQALHPGRLDALPAAVARPRYERSRLRHGIVHLGIGAFARAHLLAANDAALHAGGDLRWGVVGVSLRQPDTRDALAPQQGLYTLAIRDAAPDGAPRQRLQVVGSLCALRVAPEDPRAVLEDIAHPDARIVSLTVTEKGYCHDPASGRLRLDHPDIAHDLADAARPRSAIGFIVHGLALRRARALGPLALMSLDNLPSNGALLRGAVLDFADALDPALADWIATGCSFPNSMVDRIVPRSTDADRESVSQGLGLRDAWPVLGEPFFDWAVEDDFAAGRPDWTAGGARFVAEAAPWEKLKLRMVNGAHSSIAYLGAMAGWDTVDVAIAQPALRRHVEALMRDEIEPTLPALPGLDLPAYRAGLLARYANPALAHRTQQIAMDGSQKLPQRLLGTLRDRLAAGQPAPRVTLGIAAWLHYLRGRDELGRAHPIDDPLAAALAQHLAAAEAADDELERARRLTAFAPVFGDLAGHPALVATLAPQLRSLRGRGVRGTLEAL
ncbi:mannitol dehydrogenase family protein [Caldimonas tepidiphila]|uniref:mannitol dehydrogenase family protein n=1 Tax=Caldimonas tepidiphila TaxID=2315841 RepID=UPI000E5AADDB|nr:mannitol dehydrogenase family protein [Caldimonas tepidiphila]